MTDDESRAQLADVMAAAAIGEIETPRVKQRGQHGTIYLAMAYAVHERFVGPLLTEIEQYRAQLAGYQRPPCTCDGDPIECSHEVARAMAEHQIAELRDQHAVLATPDGAYSQLAELAESWRWQLVEARQEIRSLRADLDHEIARAEEMPW